jgi:hypothetical protein
LADVRDRLGPRLAQCLGLSLAAAFGHRFREVREQHREPQERGDEAREPVGCCADAVEVAEEQERREDAPDLDHEHDRVLGLQPRVELDETVDDRAPHDGGLEHRATAALRVLRIGLGPAGLEGRKSRGNI